MVDAGQPTQESPRDAATDPPIRENLADRPPTPVQSLVTEFLRGRDIACPKCGYNLRNATGTVCPECGVELMLHIHPRFAPGSVSSATGTFGIVLGLVMCVVATLIGLTSGWMRAVPPVFLFVTGVVQLVLWEKYHRRVRARRPDMLWVYTCSGWAIPAIIVLWIVVR